MAFNRLDIILVVLIALSTLMGIVKGFVREVVTLGSAILGLIVAGAQYTRLADAIEPQMRSREMALLVSFLSIFTAVVLAGIFLALVVTRILKEVGLTWLDRLLGGLFGLARGGVLALVVILALVAFPARVEAVNRSRLAPYLLQAASYATYLAPPDVRRRFLDGQSRLERVWHKGRAGWIEAVDSIGQSPG